MTARTRAYALPPVLPAPAPTRKAATASKAKAKPAAKGKPARTLPAALRAPMLAPIPRDLYTPEEAAVYLRCGRDKVYTLCRTGRLRSIKHGKYRVIPFWCLEEYLKSLTAGLADAYGASA